jgi:hypothetical protein
VRPIHVQRVLRAIIPVLFLAGCAAVAGNGDKHTTATRPSQSSVPRQVQQIFSEQPAPVPSVVSTTHAPGAPVAASPVAARRAGTVRELNAVSKPSPTPTKSSPKQTWLAPARPGAYRYSTTGSASYGFGSATFPSVSTLAVDPAKGSRQRSVRNLRNGEGEGLVIDQTLDYTRGGITLVKQVLTVSLGGMTKVRTLTPAATAVWLPTGAGPGTKRTFDLTGVGISGHEVVEVTGTAPVSVAGRSVRTLVIKTVITLAGSVSGPIEWTQWFSPDHRLPMKEQVSGTLRASIVRIKINYGSLLQKLP